MNTVNYWTGEPRKHTLQELLKDPEADLKEFIDPAWIIAEAKGPLKLRMSERAYNIATMFYTIEEMVMRWARSTTIEILLAYMRKHRENQPDESEKIFLNKGRLINDCRNMLLYNITKEHFYKFLDEFHDIKSPCGPFLDLNVDDLNSRGKK